MSWLPTRERWRLLAFVGYGFATFAAFPHPIAGGVVDLGIVAAPVAAGFFLLGLEGLAPRAALRSAFVASFAAHFVFFHWFYVVTVVYGHAPAPLGALAPTAPALYISLSTAVFGWAWSHLQRRSLAGPFVAAALWTVGDHFRGNFLGGFPWATLGYAQHLNVPLMGLAPYTGVYGLSFAVVLVGAGLASWFSRNRFRGAPSRRVVVAFVTAALLHLPGLLQPPLERESETIRVAAIQGDIDQAVKWSIERVDEILGIYLDLSQEAIDAGAQVVVWPETAVPGFIELDSRIRDRVIGLARRNDVALVVGATGARLDPTGTRLQDVYDSGFLIDADGVVLDRYDKTHLVPFGEFVPLRGLIGWFFEAVARGLADTDVRAGVAPRAIELPIPGLGPPGPDRVMVGVPICYELLFPDEMRHFAADGSRVLFAITNDAWYGRTGAPYQFLAMTALRSAESRLWTVRAANSGVSAIIDARGGVEQSTPIFERAFLVGDVPLARPGVPPSFYARNGDLFARVCWIAALVLVLRAVIRSEAGDENEVEERRAT